MTLAMGIPMDDIHTPPVASGPTLACRGSNSDTLPASLKGLFDDKDRLEAELKALGKVLESHGVNMSTRLTTFDGYPRDDLDVAQIRTARARIICLRNDYKDVMAKVEQGIHAHFASIGQNESALAAPSFQELTSSPNIIEERVVLQNEFTETPFARVSSVVEGSPAAQAGLKVGDKIQSFGSINWMNHENLSKVAELVQRSEGRSVLVNVIRQNGSEQEPANFTLLLMPSRNWGGQGFLGCHLLPL